MQSLYKIGRIASVGKTYIILETGYTGIVVHTARPQEFTKNDKLKVYLYEHQTEFLKACYGFKTLDERRMFEELIHVNGIGPKTALSVLAKFDNVQDLATLINNGDVNKLSELPSIGPKTAKNMVFELKDVLKNVPKVSKDVLDMLEKSLKVLGFNENQVAYTLAHMPQAESLEELVEASIKNISNGDWKYWAFDQAQKKDGLIAAAVTESSKNDEERE